MFTLVALSKKCKCLEFFFYFLFFSRFPAFGLNAEIYKVNLWIQSEFGKIRTRKSPNTDTIYAVLLVIFSLFIMKLAVVYLPKVNSGNNRTMCEISSS